MASRFQSSRERIGRADEHWAAFNDVWESAKKDGSYRVTVDVEDDGTGTLEVKTVRPLPAILSLELGEMLYQLRAALDAGVYECAVRNGGALSPADEKALEFPICATTTQWKSAAGKLRPLSKQQLRVIYGVQPCHVEEFPGTAPVVRSLGILNDWARKDRHRRLHVVRSIVEKVAAPFLPDGKTVAIEWSKYDPLHFVEGNPRDGIMPPLYSQGIIAD